MLKCCRSGAVQREKGSSTNAEHRWALLTEFCSLYHGQHHIQKSLCAHHFHQMTGTWYGMPRGIHTVKLRESTLGVQFKEKRTFCRQNLPLKRLCRTQHLKVFATALILKVKWFSFKSKAYLPFLCPQCSLTKTKLRMLRRNCSLWLLYRGGTDCADRCDDPPYKAINTSNPVHKYFFTNLIIPRVIPVLNFVIKAKICGELGYDTSICWE
jgi:hypothetical protein